MLIANISEVWIERTYTPSVTNVFVGGCMVKQAMYRCYLRLIGWRATFRYSQMCWLLVNIYYMSLQCLYMYMYLFCINNHMIMYAQLSQPSSIKSRLPASQGRTWSISSSSLPDMLHAPGYQRDLCVDGPYQRAVYRCNHGNRTPSPTVSIRLYNAFLIFFIDWHNYDTMTLNSMTFCQKTVKNYLNKW